MLNILKDILETLALMLCILAALFVLGILVVGSIFLVLYDAR